MSRRGVHRRRACNGARSRSAPPARGFLGLGRRRVLIPGIAEVRGPAASLRRDSLFRRSLAVADLLALVGAFLLTIELSARPLKLTWAALIEIPILLVAAKLTGLYDRDETLMRKTTLDEAPKLFQLATLCTVVAWLFGGLLVEGALGRHQALILWLARWPCC